MIKRRQISRRHAASPIVAPLAAMLALAALWTGGPAAAQSALDVAAREELFKAALELVTA